MQVIVVGSGKGGVGKTTITANLAVEGERQGMSVAMADFDVIKSLSRWHDIRCSESEVSSPTLIDDVKSPQEAMEKAADEGFDWLLIDTPPALLSVLQLALKIADLLVLPLRPSPIDIQTVDPVIELADQFGVPRLVVLSCTRPKSDLARGARQYLEARDIAVWEEEIADREIHASAMLRGQTAVERAPNGEAAREFQALWATARKLARQSDGKKQAALSTNPRRRG